MSKFEAKGINSKSGHLDTYLDHFVLCARNPTLPQDQTAMKQPCMSKGGIPVQPFFVLGGFPDKEYRSEVFTDLGRLICNFHTVNHVISGFFSHSDST